MVMLLFEFCCKVHKSFCFRLQEFQAARREGASVMSRLADSFHNMSAAYMMKNRDAEFDELTAYINAFADKLAVTDRVAQRLLKEQYGELKAPQLMTINAVA